MPGRDRFPLWPRFGRDESTLKNRLHVPRMAVGRPFSGGDLLLGARRIDIGDKGGGVPEDRLAAGVPDGIGPFMDFLHHRAGQAGEPGQLALDDRAAKGDMTGRGLARPCLHSQRGLSALANNGDLRTARL